MAFLGINFGYPVSFEVPLWMVRDFSTCWIKIPVRKAERKFLKVALCCLIWAIWKKRNRLVFQEEEVYLSRLKNDFVHSFWSGASVDKVYVSLFVKKLMLMVKV